MGRLLGPPIPASEKKWLEKQKVFFHATAALSPYHHVNVSPKSTEHFRVIDDNTVCYLDLTGSGSETFAHVTQNGRMTLMFVAFEGLPGIKRLLGEGEIVMRADAPSDERFNHLFQTGQFELPGFRSVVVLHVKRMTHSCGYSIPMFDYVKERTQLTEYAETRGAEAMSNYRAIKNTFSIDGLSSIGSFLQEAMPINIFQEKGYYFAQYENVVDADHPPVTTSSILIPFYKFSTFLQRFGIAGYDALTCRGRYFYPLAWDFGIFCLGLLLGILLMHQFPLLLSILSSPKLSSSTAPIEL